MTAEIAWYKWDHGIIRDFCLSWFIYATMSLIMDLLSALILSISNIQLMDHFNQPWLTISISEFWALRWNLVTGSLLRDLIYDPCIEGQLLHFDHQEKKKIKMTQKVTGTLLTFCFSGLMHWFLIWYTENVFAWKNFLFFIIQGILLIFERLTFQMTQNNKLIVNKLNQIPFVVKAGFYNCLILYLAHKLYWPEIISTGSVFALIDAVKLF